MNITHFELFVLVVTANIFSHFLIGFFMNLITGGKRDQ